MGVYLKNDTIKGDCVATGFEDQIDCSSWSLGAFQSTNMHQSTGGAAGSSEIQDLQITKSMDKASSLIYASCAEGIHLGELTLTCTRSYEGSDIKWLEIILKDTIIASVSSSATPDDLGSEAVSFNFAEYMMKFYPQEDGGAEGSSIDHGYNQATRVRS